MAERWKTVKLGMVKLSVKPLDLETTPLARKFDPHVLTMGFDPSQIRLYLGA